MNLEYLRHGKSLCGKVFRRFVETFNFHNDFITNLKGDADLPVVGGKVHLDRTDERNPVIRCQGCGNGGGGEEYKAVLPWSFSCTEADDPDNPGEKKRTGGWTNCILQLGYKTFFFSPEFRGRLGYNAIEGTDTCDDGEHYVVVDSIARTVRIEVAQSAADAPQDDPANGVVVLRIGTVREAKLTQGLHVNPVIPTYL